MQLRNNLIIISSLSAHLALAAPVAAPVPSPWGVPWGMPEFLKPLAEWWAPSSRISAEAIDNTAALYEKALLAIDRGEIPKAKPITSLAEFKANIEAEQATLKAVLDGKVLTKDQEEQYIRYLAEEPERQESARKTLEMVAGVKTTQAAWEAEEAKFKQMKAQGATPTEAR
jgi:hypothetical protein